MTLNTLFVFLLISTSNYGPSRGIETVLAHTPSKQACEDAKANRIASLAATSAALGQQPNTITCSRAEIVNMADPWKASSK
jgi:hypothetical protein